MAARLRLKTTRPKTGRYSRAALDKKYAAQDKLAAEREEAAQKSNDVIHWPLPAGYMPPERKC